MSFAFSVKHQASNTPPAIGTEAILLACAPIAFQRISAKDVLEWGARRLRCERLGEEKYFLIYFLNCQI